MMRELVFNVVGNTIKCLVVLWTVVIVAGLLSIPFFILYFMGE